MTTKRSIAFVVIGMMLFVAAFAMTSGQVYAAKKYKAPSIHCKQIDSSKSWKKYKVSIRNPSSNKRICYEALHIYGFPGEKMGFGKKGKDKIVTVKVRKNRTAVVKAYLVDACGTNVCSDVKRVHLSY